MGGSSQSLFGDGSTGNRSNHGRTFTIFGDGCTAKVKFRRGPTQFIGRSLLEMYILGLDIFYI